VRLLGRRRRREEGLEANRDDLEVVCFIIAFSLPIGEHITYIEFPEGKAVRHQAMEPRRLVLVHIHQLI